VTAGAALLAWLDRLDPWPPVPAFPPPRPPVEAPRLHVQVVRFPDGAATTLVDGKFTSVECPGCGELTTIVGCGVCLSCRRAGRRYEVVA